MNNGIEKRPINDHDFLNIINFLETKKEENYAFNLLMNKLEDVGDIIVIGGVIRDVILNECEPRDIDLIIDTEEKLDKIMNNFDNVSRNRFGGYKLLIEGLPVDVWTIASHWAFRENILKRSFENIKYSTFLNFDSVYYNITKDIGIADVFNDAMTRSFLDITLEDKYIYRNPFAVTNIIRMFVIKETWNLRFSSKVEQYIFQWVKGQSNPIESLWEAQIKHYKGKIILSKHNMAKLLKKYINLSV